MHYFDELRGRIRCIEAKSDVSGHVDDVGRLQLRGGRHRVRNPAANPLKKVGDDLRGDLNTSGDYKVGDDDSEVKSELIDTNLIWMKND